MNDFPGPVIEFLEYPPYIVSAGHDGLFPDQIPLDEIYVKAEKGERPSDMDLHCVEIWLHNSNDIHISNNPDFSPKVRIHRSGYLWHDRARDLINPFLETYRKPLRGRWLSVYGITTDDPRKFHDEIPQLLTQLPRTYGDFHELFPSGDWQKIKDFHTRNREWMKNKQRALPFAYEAIALRYERDVTLVAKIKQARGSACQVCGYKFTKKDGTDYCEVHHLEALSDGGLDIAANMLVLCANCHRVFHYGSVEVQNHTSSKITLTIDGNPYSCDLW